MSQQYYKYVYNSTIISSRLHNSVDYFRLIDTKVISSTHLFKGEIPFNSLDELVKSLESALYEPVKISKMTNILLGIVFPCMKMSLLLISVSNFIHSSKQITY